MKTAVLAAVAIALLNLSPLAHATEEGSRPGDSALRAAQSRETSANPITQASQADAQPGSAESNQSGASGSSAGRKPTILEFGDLQCPDSAAFASQGRQQLMRDFVQSGQAKYSFHDFPLDAHPLAARAAEIARCSGPNADRMRDQMLQNQASLRTEQDLLAASGMAPQALEQCLASGEKRAAVQQDRALGQKYGVRATPTLVLGYSDGSGRFTPTSTVRGDQPYATVRSAVQELVASAGPSGQKSSSQSR